MLRVHIAPPNGGAKLPPSLWRAKKTSQPSISTWLRDRGQGRGQRPNTSYVYRRTRGDRRGGQQGKKSYGRAEYISSREEEEGVHRDKGGCIIEVPSSAQHKELRRPRIRSLLSSKLALEGLPRGRARTAGSRARTGAVNTAAQPSAYSSGQPSPRRRSQLTEPGEATQQDHHTRTTPRLTLFRNCTA